MLLELDEELLLDDELLDEDELLLDEEELLLDEDELLEEAPAPASPPQPDKRQPPASAPAIS